VTTQREPREYRLALIGFGNVGQGFAEILRERGADFERRFGARFTIVAVADTLKGSVYDPEGLDPKALLDAIAATGSLDGVAAPRRGLDAPGTIAETNADAVLELSYTDLRTGEPALGHVRLALDRGKHVVTTNKGPVALHYAELARLAAERGVELGVEGTVMSGTPTLCVGRELLGAAGIRRVQGILNGTTNFILTEMERGSAYPEALAEAQRLGYAEADPTGDVEGFDAAAKVVILANLLMGAELTMADVERTGITGLGTDDVAAAAAAGERWKLIGSVSSEEGRVTASVRPTRLPLSNPLAAVSGATNAITFSTDLLGDVTVVGPGAGRLATGYALVGDLLAIHRAVRP
jgi:homoserine dehydrogenase